MTLVLAAMGLKREAALIVGDGVSCVVGGGRVAALRARLEDALAERPVAGLISVGLGGALSPALDVGDWVVGDRIVNGVESWPTDAMWTRHLVQRLGSSAKSGAILGSDAMILGAESKAELYASTGALAVDMESHVVARVAGAHGLPFAALRVVSDAADRNLPKTVLAGMRPDGGLNVLGVVWALAKSPRRLPELMRTGAEADKAFRRLALLGRHNLLCGPGIGCPYFRELLLDVT